MGNCDAGAHGKTDEQVYDKVDQRARGADRGKRNVPAPAADHDKVRGVEQKLENARCHNGQRIEKKLFQKGALGHLLPCHCSKH